MKITNRLNLPQPLVSAVINDDYTKGDADISVTALIGPPRIAALRLQYEDEIEEDASDRLWSLFGQIPHGILERANIDGIAEAMLFIELEGWKIKAQMDRIQLLEKKLQDWKFTSVWSAKYGVKPEWEKQLNCYRYIAHLAGYEIDYLEVIAMFRDWSIGEARRDPLYQQTQVGTFPVNVWSFAQTEKYMRERVKLHQAARVELPLCSDEDRWKRGEKWALMKKGNSKATKTSEFKELMEAMAKEKGADYFVEKRGGVPLRCMDYCPVRNFCSQFQNEQTGASDTDITELFK